MYFSHLSTSDRISIVIGFISIGISIASLVFAILSFTRMKKIDENTSKFAEEQAKIVNKNSAEIKKYVSYIVKLLTNESIVVIEKETNLAVKENKEQEKAFSSQDMHNLHNIIKETAENVVETNNNDIDKKN